MVYPKRKPIENMTFPETADIETSSEDYARRFAGEIGSWFLSVQEKATIRMLAPYSGARILDVGGGHGQITHALISKGFDVTVLGSTDICKLRIQRFLDEKRCSFNVGNLVDLPYANGSFDFVISYRLLPHVSQWVRFLSELARVAEIGVLIDYPSLRSINAIAPHLFRFKKQIEGNTRPFTVFREADLLRVFESLGFQRADRYAQFVLPMVIHRMLKSPAVSSAVERGFRLVGATRVFGSPVILKLLRKAMVRS